MPRRWVEKRTRGFFGWIFLVLFWGWNALMAIATVSAMSNVAELGQRTMTDAERMGHDIGTGLGFTMVLGLWAVGAIVFGLLSHFSRGKVEMIEVES